jgi:formylglycine-generating enzyme required for sulfatase activity
MADGLCERSFAKGRVMDGKGDSVEHRLVGIETELKRIRSLYERTLSYGVNDPETALMHARKAAEAICRQLFISVYGANPGPLTLDQLIDKLNARDALPRAMAIPLRTIQGYGNYAAHDHGGSGPDGITTEYIQPCLKALATVVEWYFAEHGRPPTPHDGSSQVDGETSPPEAQQHKEGAIRQDGPPKQARRGGMRVTDIARKLGISDAAAVRLVRQHLLVEIRAPSATLSPEQVTALEAALATPAPSDEAATRKRSIVLEEGTNMEFALVPSGSFTMGSPVEEEGHMDDEIEHLVTISRAFYLGVVPVTQRQYEALVHQNGSYFCGPDLPVEMISWFDAVAYCEALTERFGHKFRIPTEAEWEYACRAGTRSAFSLGDLLTTDHANVDGKFIYGKASQGVTRWKTTPVGSFRPNAFGLFDMHGNVWEWCADWYGAYPTQNVTDPAGPAEGAIRVFRGGSWFDGAADARSAQRDAHDPGRRHSIYGFRVLMERA